MDALQHVRSLVREHPDWPTAGVVFRDLTPVLADPHGFRSVTDALAEQAAASRPDAVVGIEARGWPWAAGIALNLGIGLVCVRKAGKLPGAVHREDYALEYATASIEMLADGVVPGHRCVLVDDVLATGGTMAAARGMVDRAGGTTVGAVVVAEIPALGGRQRLHGLDVRSLLEF